MNKLATRQPLTKTVQVVNTVTPVVPEAEPVGANRRAAEPNAADKPARVYSRIAGPNVPNDLNIPTGRHDNALRRRNLPRYARRRVVRPRC